MPNNVALVGQVRMAIWDLQDALDKVVAVDDRPSILQSVQTEIVRGSACRRRDCSNDRRTMIKVTFTWWSGIDDELFVYADGRGPHVCTHDGGFDQGEEVMPNNVVRTVRVSLSDPEIKAISRMLGSSVDSEALPRIVGGHHNQLKTARRAVEKLLNAFNIAERI